MIKNTRTFSTNKIVYEYYFNNLVELIDYISTAEINDKIFKKLSSEKNSYEWLKTHSLDEAKKLCLTGDKELIDLFNEKNSNMTEIFPYLTQKRNIVPSYYGHRPNINKYLTSNPKSMYKLQRNQTHNVIDINYSCSAPHYCSTNSIINRGIITINTIKLLENLGYRVRFNFFVLVKEDNEYFYSSIVLKRPEEKLSSNICVFPMCHPSFFRRIIFRVMETTNFNVETWSYTYGVSLYLKDIHETYKLILNKEINNSILIGMPESTNIYGYDLLEDTKNFLEVIDINKYLGDNKLEYNNNTKNFTLKRKK